MAKKKVAAIAAIAVGVFMVTGVMGILLVPNSGELLMRLLLSRDRHKVERGRIRVLCETDHQALLDACRELSRRAQSANQGDFYEGSDISRLPRVIRDLRPSFVIVPSDGFVEIELGTKFYVLGVHAYPDGYSEPSGIVQSEFPERKLLEGLWYYDEGFWHHRDEYDKEIERILQKHGKLKASEKTDPSE